MRDGRERQRGEIASFLETLRADPALESAFCHHEVLPPEPAIYADTLPPDCAGLEPVLRRRGIDRIYRHQARALEALSSGDDVVLATHTASGKTLVYNFHVLRRALRDPMGRSLYLFPLKALAADQRQGLEQDIRALRRDLSTRVEIYDGDTPAGKRQKIRRDPPQVLITTPDMLHFGILPFHAAWDAFFRDLHTVVIDELHVYRGIFGSHASHIFRRLDRVARFHHAAPQFIAASGTIANPGELAQALVDRPFEVIHDDGSPRTRRDVVLLNPSTSPYTTAARLFRTAVKRGLRTIAFTKARKITELMHAWVIEADPSLDTAVSSYRAGFLPAERREIEGRLFSGELLGVIATSALEMGIDVGALDVCILVGYPGSQVALWQRSGRVGRERDAAVVLVAQPDALDQYLVAHPRTFFQRGFEHAVIDPRNPEISAGHLACAAAEVPLREAEPWLADAARRELVETLEAEGALLRSASGNEWFAARRSPHRDLELRAAGRSFSIATENPRTAKRYAIGSIGAPRAQIECHEGAIYLHRGRQYRVTELDWDAGTVLTEPVDTNYYTRALSDKDTEILSRDEERQTGVFTVVRGRVRVTTTVTSYERREVHGQTLLGTEPLDLPPTSFETTSLWLEFPETIPSALRAAEHHPMGGIHASEHAALSLFPLFALCDRFDAAGISYVAHPQLRRPAIFFYDGIPGGAGIAAGLFHRVEDLLSATLEMIRDCECEEGCPACIHSPKCGSGNRPLDKGAAIQVLGWLLGLEVIPEVSPIPDDLPETPSPAIAHDVDPVSAPELPGETSHRVVFFDLETQRSAREVGGWHNAHLMRLALAVVYDSAEEQYRTYFEADVEALVDHLECADLVVGFNARRFDLSVLRGYTSRRLDTLPLFDMLESIHSRLGYRLPLGHLGEETLGEAKGGDGLQSLEWWREGKVEDVQRYCERDVAILKGLFEHGRDKGHLLFRTKSGSRVRLPVHWPTSELVERCRAGDHGPADRQRGAESAML